MNWRTLVDKATRAIEAVQVEFHGQYSADRLMQLADYCERTNGWRSLFVLVTAPLPCLIVIVLLELPSLDPPDAGVRGNVVFWVRATAVSFISSLTIFMQFHNVLGLPPIKWPRTLVAMTAVAVGSTIASYALGVAIGFPLPFFAIVTAQPWTGLFVGALWLLWRKFYREDPELWPQTVAYTKVLMCQSAMTFVYPVFYHIFSRLSSLKQTAFSLLLPVIKVALKNLMSRQFQHNGDLRPEEIIFSIEIFSALFVTFCMQQSASLLPVVALTVVDFLHACLALQDIHRMARDIYILQPTVIPAKLLNTLEVLPFNTEAPTASSPTPRDKVESTLHYTSHLLERMGTARRGEFIGMSWRWSAKIWPSVVQTAGVAKKRKVAGLVPQSRKKRLPSLNLLPHKPNSVPDRSDSHTGTGNKFSSREISAPTEAMTEEDKYVRKVLHLLHATEYIVLVEFTEVIIPLVYSIYVAVITQLPNRAYYDYLRDMDSANLQRVTSNVFIYSVLELLSLVILDAVIRWRLKFSLLTQLAFVLEKQRKTIISKLVLWIVYIIQGSLQHYGTDYTFRFAWLRGEKK